MSSQVLSHCQHCQSVQQCSVLSPRSKMGPSTDVNFYVFGSLYKSNVFKDAVFYFLSSNVTGSFLIIHPNQPNIICDQNFLFILFMACSRVYTQVFISHNPVLRKCNTAHIFRFSNSLFKFASFSSA